MSSFSLQKWYWPLLVVLLTSACLKADDQWVGKDVMPKRGRPKITRTDADGVVVVVGTIDRYPVTVREEKGEWVKVQVRDKAGWILKDHVVRVDEGIQYFTGRIQSNDDLAEAYVNRAWLWTMKGEPDTAIKDADEALRLNPSCYTYNVRGNAWLSKEEYDKAIHDYGEALRLDPKDARPFNNRGLARAYKKEYDKAIQDYDEAIRISANQRFISADHPLISAD